MNKSKKLSIVLTAFIFVIVGCDQFNKPNKDKYSTSNRAASTEIINLPGKLSFKDYIAYEKREDLRATLGLGINDSLMPLKTITAKDKIHTRYQFMHNNIPVWGIHVLTGISQESIVSLHGQIVKNIDMHPFLNSVQTTSENAESYAVFDFINKNSGINWFTWVFRKIRSDIYIYIEKEGTARKCYLVSFLASSPEAIKPYRMYYFIDTFNGDIILSYNNIMNAKGTGPGGNLKTGKYHYGSNYPAFEVTQKGSTCIMENSKVKTIDMNNQAEGISTAYSYPCYINTHKSVNGAYSPLNDAHFFGGVVINLYNDWFNTSPLMNKLILKVHYFYMFENAGWTGDAAVFGDGQNMLYPTTSLELIAHEVAHGFTEQNSNLDYSDYRSSPINESFSDAAAEAAEYYFSNSNDFKFGFKVVKDPNKALRYMYDPPLDGVSIDHVDDFSVGMDPHYSSGIFNKAFYLMASSPGWNTKKVFELYVKANQVYWTPKTKFQSGAQGILDAAADLGYNTSDVINAFDQVGIKLEGGISSEVVEADFSYTVNGKTVNFNDESTCNNCTITSWNWDFGDGSSGSNNQNSSHTYSTSGTYNVLLKVETTSGIDNTETKQVEIEDDVGCETFKY